MKNIILESIDKAFEGEESLESKLTTIIDLYYEDKSNEDGDTFAGTEDSYAEEMLLQRIEELQEDNPDLDIDNIYSSISLSNSEDEAIEEAKKYLKTEIKESEFDAADIADSWDDFMKWIEEDPNRCDAANHISDTGNIADADFDSKEFRDLFRAFKDSQLEEDQQLSKLDLMAGEVITQLNQIKAADSSIKIDRPYVEQYMNTAYGSSSALDDRDVGYILGRVLKYFKLSEAEGDQFLPKEMRDAINKAIDKSIKNQKEAVDDEDYDDDEPIVKVSKINRDVISELNIPKEQQAEVRKYIRGMLRYYILEDDTEGKTIGGSNFNPGTRRKGDEEDRKKMVQRSAGVIDPERREKAIARIKKYWPRVPKSWLNSRTDEYLEQTADHYEAMEARKLAAQKARQASVS